MIKLYSNKMSNNCLKVLWTAQLTGTELDVQEMDFGSDIKTEAYLKIHPLGMVPAAEDEGQVILESNALMRYVARKAKSELYPEGDPLALARIDQWIEFSNWHVGQPMGRVAFNRAWAPLMGLPVNEAAITEGEQALTKHLPVVERQLAGQPFLAGEELSLADVALLAATFYAEPSQVDLAGCPALVAWRTKLMRQLGAEPIRLG